MKYFLNINQSAIVKNDLHKIGDLNTWALFDFLCFFNNAEYHKVIKRGEIEYKWVNYKYIIESLPLCDFYNQKIKKHLDILQENGMIECIKDECNNLYFRLLPKHKILFEDNCLPSKEITNSQVKNYQPPREDFTHNNNKESIIKNNNTPPVSFYKDTTPKGENVSEKKRRNLLPQKQSYSDNFSKWWDLWVRVDRNVGKVIAYELYTQAVEEVGEDLLYQALESDIKEWGRSGTQKRYIPHPQNWLKSRRFDAFIEQYKGYDCEEDESFF